MAAWDELGMPTPAAELREAVAPDLAVLRPGTQAPAADSVPAAETPPAPDSPTPSAPTPPVPEAAAAVETAAAGVDTHADALKGDPEWQRIQTVRSALRNVWDVMKTQAGDYWERLRNDVRFQGFWKTVSIRACEAISDSATALANRLRPDLPAFDALQKLSDAAITYSTVASAEPVTEAPAPTPVKEPDPKAGIPMQRLVERGNPIAYATRDDAVRAAEEISERFQSWIQSPMGKEVVGSSHKRVLAFRDAWTQLPPHDAEPGPAVGAYGQVAERAQALLALAVDSGRFAPADLKALQGLARAADAHSARLSVTLPPGTAHHAAQKAAMPAPQVAAPAPSAARSPRASA